jgi:ElaB/YqjD/DUF883 family membrane-anchored ribosome-binding protein
MGKTADEIDDTRSTGSEIAADTDEDVLRRTAEIKASIAQTRAELGETINALQSKLEPEKIKTQIREKVSEGANKAMDSAKEKIGTAAENAKQATREKAEKMITQVSGTVSNATRKAGSAARDTGNQVYDYVRANPVPVTIIGAGLGALAMYGYLAKSHSGGGSSTEAAADMDYDYEESDYEREPVGEFDDNDLRVAGESWPNRARQVGNRSVTMVKNHGMAMGLAALAAGALIGMALPLSRTESRYLGDARTRFVNRAKEWYRQTTHHSPGDVDF